MLQHVHRLLRRVLYVPVQLRLLREVHDRAGTQMCARTSPQSALPGSFSS